MVQRIDCPCQVRSSADTTRALEQLEIIRSRCAALREILVPDNIWPIFKQKAAEPYDQAFHHYILLGALRDGFLARITFPIHRFLLDTNKPKRSLTRQYKKDLAEKWMLKSTPLERHREARIFFGKLTELLMAAWLEEQGWRINTLEALAGVFDIEATSPDKISFAIEVKYIGQLDSDFEEIVGKLSMGTPAGGTVNPYERFNYLMLRVYEAAKHLLDSNKRRLVAVVISQIAWGFFERQISDGWLQKRPIPFAPDTSPEWAAFLAEKKAENKFSHIERDLDRVIHSLNELWIVVEQNYLSYQLKNRFTVSNGS